MFEGFNPTEYFKETLRSTKFQISSFLSFGAALALICLEEDSLAKIFFTILFTFPLCIFVLSLCEKIYLKTIAAFKKHQDWNFLSKGEEDFIIFYITNKTKTRYVTSYNGACKDCGVFHPLIKKNILYYASDVSEYRGDSWQSMSQEFPINITDDAYRYFEKKYLKGKS